MAAEMLVIPASCPAGSDGEVRRGTRTDWSRVQHPSLDEIAIRMADHPYITITDKDGKFRSKMKTADQVSRVSLA
jgi:hypothetical protein